MKARVKEAELHSHHQNSWRQNHHCYSGKEVAAVVVATKHWRSNLKIAMALTEDQVVEETVFDIEPYYQHKEEHFDAIDIVDHHKDHT